MQPTSPQWSAFAVDLAGDKCVGGWDRGSEKARFGGTRQSPIANASSSYASRRSRARAELPVVQHQVALWQIVHLPSFHTSAIPVDLGVTERDEP